MDCCGVVHIFPLADIDADGVITIKDAALILTYYAQYDAGLNPTWEELTSTIAPTADIDMT